jgi:hypothetical protein
MAVKNAGWYYTNASTLLLWRTGTVATTVRSSLSEILLVPVAACYYYVRMRVVSELWIDDDNKNQMTKIEIVSDLVFGVMRRPAFNCVYAIASN